ncbi:MAG: hypothetical protein ACXWEY_16855, partial [Bacteroidia bacterium]
MHYLKNGAYWRAFINLKICQRFCRIFTQWQPQPTEEVRVEIITLIKEYQSKVDVYLENGEFRVALREELLMQVYISKIAEVNIRTNSKIGKNEVICFTCQAAVGRQFGDFGLDWVVWNYYEISYFILK